MTDPDTLAAFNARRAAASDTIENAVLDHLEKGDLTQPPTDDEVFGGVPTEIADVPTAPMRVPQDIVQNPFEENENWEDAETVVRKVPEFRPHDPSFCMM